MTCANIFFGAMIVTIIGPEITVQKSCNTLIIARHDNHGKSVFHNMDRFVKVGKFTSGNSMRYNASSSVAPSRCKLSNAKKWQRFLRLKSSRLCDAL